MFRATNKLAIAALAALLFGCSEAKRDQGEILEEAAGSSASVAQDWSRFLEWWPGNYDNLAQVDEIASEGGQTFMPPTALYIRRVDLPSFGDNVFYAEWHNAENPAEILRQRFYAFEQEGSVFRLNLHIFPPDGDFVARTAGAYSDPAKLDGVTPQDMFPLPGCDVFFSWDDGKFSGAMRKQSCNFQAPGTDVAIYSWSQMRLEEGAFEYLDGWFHREDDTVFRQFSDRWIEFKKR